MSAPIESSPGLERLAEAMAHRLPQVLDEVRRVLEQRSPDYAAFVTEEFEEVVRAGRPFVRRLIMSTPGLSAVGPADATDGLQAALFEEIGREHYRDGREIGELLSAYRAGARVAWSHLAAAALELQVPPGTLSGLAAGVFAAIDQLSAASMRGFLQEQQHGLRAREQLRDELAELLLSDRADTLRVHAAADRAGWILPRRAAVVLIDSEDDVARERLDRLAGDCLRLRRAGGLVTIVPDPLAPTRRERLTRALAGCGAVVGEAVPVEGLPASLRLAEAALRLKRRHQLDDDPTFAGEHLDALIVHQDDELLGALRQRCLAPLDGLTPPVRERLEDTLRSWLVHMGDRRAVAAELGVHPHTVSYRLNQLRELFGPDLDDSRRRAALTVALVWGEATEDG
jgi:hypothetical protein